MAGLYFNDGHYAGPELGGAVFICWLERHLPWSLSGLPLVSLWTRRAPLGASDLLALVALRLSGSGTRREHNLIGKLMG